MCWKGTAPYKENNGQVLAVIGGARLTSNCIDPHFLNHWAVLLAKELHKSWECDWAMVELACTRAQFPHKGERIPDFLRIFDGPAELRQLRRLFRRSKDFYWACAYSKRQHALGRAG